jgi:hypothetical protein
MPPVAGRKPRRIVHIDREQFARLRAAGRCQSTDRGRALMSTFAGIVSACCDDAAPVTTAPREKPAITPCGAHFSAQFERTSAVSCAQARWRSARRRVGGCRPRARTQFRNEACGFRQVRSEFSDEVICVGSTFCISYRCRTGRRRFDAVTAWYFATLLSL